MQTLEILNEALGCTTEIDPIWLERNVGEMENTKYTVLDDFSDLSKSLVSRSPYHDAYGKGGEGQWLLQIRASQGLHALLNKAEGDYLVITHGGMLNALMHSILGIGPGVFGSGPRFVLDNTGFAEFTYAADRHRWTLVRFNDPCHLRDVAND